MGKPFQTLPSIQKFFAGTTQNVVFYYVSNRTFRKLFVNGKHPIVFIMFSCFNYLSEKPFI